MGTSFTGEVSSDRLTSCRGDGESLLSAKHHRNLRLAPTLRALWLEKTKTYVYLAIILCVSAKLVELAYGIKKLQIMCTVEDEKVSVEDLREQIEAFEDFVSCLVSLYFFVNYPSFCFSDSLSSLFLSFSLSHCLSISVSFYLSLSLSLSPSISLSLLSLILSSLFLSFYLFFSVIFYLQGLYFL